MSSLNVKNSLVVAAVIAFIAVLLSDLYSPYLEIVLISGIPFIGRSVRLSAAVSFGIGLFTTLGIILSNPPLNVWNMSTILSSITGIPSLLILLVYPILVAAMSASSAFIFSYLTSSQGGSPPIASDR
ncbi:MAG TPA: hypothetical protein VKU79_08010 [Thermoplasmataceae archaeon]|nr:hypothetical protein [Thermoplasmatales archaeon AK]HLH86786.1 hypothetical protein [Thermoplasmataceae archaeon]